MTFKTYGYKLGAAMTVGILSATPSSAHAGNTFSSISENITESISSVPGLLTGVSYLMGLLLGVLGVLKIKDHVENPTQTQIKDGAIRLAAGGALFALPILFEAMFETIGADGQATNAAELNKVEFNVN